MPWEAVSGHPGCGSGEWAVVTLGGGELVACHATREEALRQVAALYANEGEAMSQAAVRLEGSSTLAANDIGEGGLQLVHVMPSVEKARNGAWYFTITREDLATYAEFIRANPDRIPVDYDHQGASERGGSTRAAGWYTGRAEVREDGLWAEVRWTPRAQQEIRDGEFRFLSPEFTFAKRDEKSGLMTKAKELLASTLTNRPFFRQLNPVTADEVDEVTLSFGQEVADLLTSEEEPTAVQLIDAIKGAVWTTAYINDLPDSSFLYVESGEKDGEGKTTPRSLRHFPYKDAQGNVDLPHLRNAIARAPQADLPQSVKDSVQSRARSILERMTAAMAEEEPPEEPPADAPVDEAEAEPAADAPEDAPAQEAEAPPADAEEQSPAESGELETIEGENMDKDILSALGVPDHADEPTILAAIQAKDEEIAQLKEQVVGLQATSDEAVTLANRVNELERQARAREIGIVLADEVRAGRVAPVEVESLTKHYTDNIDGLKELVNARPMGMFAGTREIGSGGEGSSVGNAEHAALAKEMRASDPLDPDSADAHLGALKVLAERGKPDSYTPEEYLDALDAWSRAQAGV